MSVAADAGNQSRLTLLLVEDDAMVRQVVAITLRRGGFVVIEASDGLGGLEILQSDRAIDGVLSDVRMPRLNGYELAVASLSLRPGMPVILMTGYTDEAMPDAVRDAAIPIMRKPLNFATLADSVREMIGRP